MKKEGNNFLAFHSKGEKIISTFYGIPKECAHYRFFNYPVTIFSNRKEMLELISSGFHHFVDRGGEIRTDAIKIQIMGRPEKYRENDIYYLMGPDKKCYTFSDKLAVFPYVSGFLLNYLFDRLQHLHFIHAASLSLRGQGIILVGDGKSGKTSLSVALMKNGFSYLSDEFAVIEPARKQLLAFPKCLYLRDDTFSFFPDLKARRREERSYHFGDEKRWLIDPKEIFYGKISSKANLRFFVFLHPNFDKPSGLEAIDPVSAFSRLIECSYNLRYQDPVTREKHLLLLLEILGKASCHRLQHGNAQASADLLTDLMSTPGKEEKMPLSNLDVSEITREVKRRITRKSKS